MGEIFKFLVAASFGFIAAGFTSSKLSLYFFFGPMMSVMFGGFVWGLTNMIVDHDELLNLRSFGFFVIGAYAFIILFMSASRVIFGTAD